MVSMIRPDVPLRIRVQRVVDVIERELVGHDAAVAHLAGIAQAHDTRDVACRLALAAFRALQHLLEVERQRVDLGLIAGNTDEDATHLLRGDLVGELDQILDAGGLDDLVGSISAGDGPNLGGHILGRFQINLIEAGSGAVHVLTRAAYVKVSAQVLEACCLPPPLGGLQRLPLIC